MKRLILIADNRGSEIVQYRKLIGFKVFFKKIIAMDDVKKDEQPTIFIRKVKLLDLITKQYEYENVFLRVKSKHKKFAEVEVI